MRRNTIGGRLDPAALSKLYGGRDDRTPQQQPTPDRNTARVAAHELRARGLTPLDIAQALGLSEGAVLDLLSAQAPDTNRR